MTCLHLVPSWWRCNREKVDEWFILSVDKPLFQPLEVRTPPVYSGTPLFQPLEVRTPLYTVELLYSNSLKWGHYLCIQWNSSIPTPWSEDTSAHNGIPLLFQPPEMRTLRTFGHIPNSLGHTSADRDTKSQGTDKEYNIYIILAQTTLWILHLWQRYISTHRQLNLKYTEQTRVQFLCLHLLSEPFIQLFLGATGCVDYIRICDNPETGMPRRYTLVHRQDTQSASHGKIKLEMGRDVDYGGAEDNKKVKL